MLWRIRGRYNHCDIFFFLLQAWKNKHVIVLLDWHEFMLMGSWISSTVDKDNAF